MLSVANKQKLKNKITGAETIRDSAADNSLSDPTCREKRLRWEQTDTRFKLLRANYRKQIPIAERKQDLTIEWNLKRNEPVKIVKGYTCRLDDGGRSKYFVGNAGDCGARALALATGLDYKEILNNCANVQQKYDRLGRRSAAQGINDAAMATVAASYGWIERILAPYGGTSPCKLFDDLMPPISVIATIKKHYTYWDGRCGVDIENPMIWCRDNQVYRIHHHIDDTKEINQYLVSAGLPKPPAINTKLVKVAQAKKNKEILCI